MGYELKMNLIAEFFGIIDKAKERMNSLMEKYVEEETRVDIVPFTFYSNGEVNTRWLLKFWHGKIKR